MQRDLIDAINALFRTGLNRRKILLVEPCEIGISVVNVTGGALSDVQRMGRKKQRGLIGEYELRE